MALLRRIIGPDGKQIHQIGERDLIKYLDDKPAFIKDVVNKFLGEIIPRGNIGLIAQKGIHKYTFFFGNVRKYTIDFDVKFDAEDDAVLEEFLSTYNLFFCTFYTSQSGVTHAVLIKRIIEEGPNNGKFLFVDPHGFAIASANSVFTKDQYNHLKIIFQIQPERDFLYSECPFQSALPVCTLWGLLLIAHKDSKPEKLFEMFDNTADLLKKQRNNVTRDLILLTIFDLFLKKGFVTEAEIAQYPPETYLNGLGRCKKCGGIK